MSEPFQVDPVQASRSRRDFLRQAMLAGAAAPTLWQAARSQEPKSQEPTAAEPKSANEKLNVAVVGVANRGASNLRGVAGENIAVLCDVDSRNLDKAAEQFPHAKKFVDFREALETPNLDCVVVSTPDHTHAFPVVQALKKGLGVYCEKPLAHSVWEVRQIREWAVKKQAVTQLGTQVHNTGDNYRRVVEIVQSGQLGDVTRVHVWLGGGMRVFDEAKTEPVPPEVNYDLWVGPSPMRPFSPAHFHFNWRYWWDFGNGALGDFGCHYMDLPHWALDLRAPKAVECQGAIGHQGVNDMPADLKVDYHYPARGAKPPVHLTWYQGAYRPEELKTYGEGKNSAVLFEGTGGRLLADYRSRKVFQSGSGLQQDPPRSIPDSPGHHAEFLQAVRSGRTDTTCNFDYSGALTETVLLGNVAYRAGVKRLEWDDAQLKAVNCEDAARFVRREYREGWTL